MSELNSMIMLISFYILDMADKYHIDLLKHLGIEKYFKYDNLILEFLFNKEGEYNLTLLKRISEILGVSVRDILTRNEKSANIYYEKYLHVFELYDTYQKVIKEASEKALNMSKVVISFWQIPALIAGLNEMCDAYKKLFLKALNQELELDEVLEMNFLAHFLEITDVFITDRYLTYEVVRNRRELYLEEAQELECTSICVFHRLLELEPWKCIEFAGNIAVSEFLYENNPLWLNAFMDWLDELNDGLVLHFSLENDNFDCEVQCKEDLFKFSQFDKDKKNYRKEVFEWVKNLYKISEYWSKEYFDNPFNAHCLPTEIGCARMENRKKYVG